MLDYLLWVWVVTAPWLVVGAVIFVRVGTISDSRRRTDESGLVQCPQDPDRDYFAWYCREQKALGIEPCATCEAMEKSQTLQEIMDETTRS